MVSRWNMKIEFLNKIISKAHNHVYANDGLSNSEALEELLKLMYCKIEFEKNDSELDPADLKPNELLVRTKSIYKSLTNKYPEIFSGKLKLSDETIIHIITLFFEIRFSDLKADKKGHILQMVMDRSYRERNGQFFTPNPVVDFIVKMIDPLSSEEGADPACGTGGFLFSALEYIYQKENKNALENMYFYEISEPISRLIRMRTLFEFDKQEPNLFVGDSLSTELNIKFDYILSNPPFGSQGKINNKLLLQKFELGRDPNTNEILSNQVPDILFVEKIVKTLKNGGRAAIVLPDGDLENPTTLYLREYLLRNVKLDAVVSLPNGTFIPYGTGVKASVVFFTKLPSDKLAQEKYNDYGIFFSKITKLGYTFSKHSKEEFNENGEIDQDYDKVIDSYKNKKYDNQSFIIKHSELIRRTLFSQSFHSPEYNQIINSIKKGKFARLGDIVEIENKKIKIIPDKYYDYVEIADVSSTGSEIINSEQILGEYLPSRASYIIRKDNVLVAVAGNAIGTKKHSRAIVTSEFNGCVCTNGFAVLKPKSISPYYLLYFLNSDLFLSQIRKYRYGSAIPTIAKEDLLNIVVPLEDKLTTEKIENNIKKAYEYKMMARKLMESSYSD